MRNPRKATLVAVNLPLAQTGGDGVHNGLHLDVRLRASGLDDALQAAIPIANDFAAELAVLAAARCGRPSPRIVVDVDPNNQVHSFRQYVPVDFDVSRRRLTPSKVQFFRSSLAEFPEEHRKRVRRSIHAYYQAMAARDPLVEFLLLWVSLEALEGLLRVRLNLRDSKPLEGIKTWFGRRVEDGAGTYDAAYSLRNRFAHGSRELEQMIEDAAALVGPMRLASRDAIAWSIRTHWEGERRPLKNWPVTAVVEFPIQAPKGIPLGVDGDLPHVRIKGVTPFDLDRSGTTINFATTVAIEERFGPGVERGPHGKAWLEGEQVALNRMELLTEDGVVCSNRSE